MLDASLFPYRWAAYELRNSILSIFITAANTHVRIARHPFSHVTIDVVVLIQAKSPHGFPLFFGENLSIRTMPYRSKKSRCYEMC